MSKRETTEEDLTNFSLRYQRRWLKARQEAQLRVRGMIPNLLAGDLILTRDNTILSKGIRFFEKLMTKKSRFSHAAISLGGRMIIEALWEVQINKIEKYEDKEILIYRYLNLTSDQRSQLMNWYMLRAGNNYPIWRIPLNAFDSVISFIRRKPTFFFTRAAGLEHFTECAQLFQLGFEKIIGNVGFSADWKSVTPDILDDDFAKLVFNKKSEIIFYNAK